MYFFNFCVFAIFPNFSLFCKFRGFCLYVFFKFWLFFFIFTFLHISWFQLFRDFLSKCFFNFSIDSFQNLPKNLAKPNLPCLLSQRFRILTKTNPRSLWCQKSDYQSRQSPWQTRQHWHATHPHVQRKNWKLQIQRSFGINPKNPQNFATERKPIDLHTIPRLCCRSEKYFDKCQNQAGQILERRYQSRKTLSSRPYWKL